MYSKVRISRTAFEQLRFQAAPETTRVIEQGSSEDNCTLRVPQRREDFWPMLRMLWGFIFPRILFVLGTCAKPAQIGK